MSNRIEIQNLDIPPLLPYANLTEPQLLHYYEPEAGLFIAESPKVISRALAAGYQIESVLCATEAKDAETQNFLQTLGDTPIYIAPESILKHLTGFVLTRGVLAAMRRKPLPDAQTLCHTAKRIAVLENVVNPTNLGAIIRSAAALEIEAVLLTPACTDPLYRRAARVSMGTVFQVPWTYLDSDLTYIQTLRTWGFQTAAMALCDNTLSIDDLRLANIDRLAIVLGTEGDGLRPETIAASDFTVKIPMAAGVDSLNVAAASAVAFWQLGRHSKI